MFLVNGRHQCGGGRKDFIDENENSLFRSEFDAFTNDVAELADCQVGGDKVLFLIDDGDIGFLYLLANHLSTS